MPPSSVSHAIAEMRQRRPGHRQHDADEHEPHQVGGNGVAPWRSRPGFPRAAFTANLGERVASALDAGARRARPPERRQLQPRRSPSARVRCAARPPGTSVHLLDLYALGFRRSDDRPTNAGAYHTDEPDRSIRMVREHAALVQSAEALVFVYPTWWSGQPAILKGWLERVFVPGVGFRFNDAGQGAARVCTTSVTWSASAPTARRGVREGRQRQRATHASCARSASTPGGAPARRGSALYAHRHRTDAGPRGVPRHGRATDEGAVKVYVVHCHPLARLVRRSVPRPRASPACRPAATRCACSTCTPTGSCPSSPRGNASTTSPRPTTSPTSPAYAADLRGATTLVLVYPTWFSGQPAMLKGWIDRVWVQGVAYDLPEGGNRIRPSCRTSAASSWSPRMAPRSG